jgi:HSP20 family protein
MAEQTEKAPQSVAVWDPWQQLERLQDEFDRLWGTQLFTRRGPGLAKLSDWRPRCDVFEDGNELVVKAELPGVKREDIEVELDDGMLTIKGSRKEEKEVKEEHYHRMERSSGSFYRQIPLPGAVSSATVKATHKDGVLEIRVPKPAPEPSKATKITVG